MYNRKLLKLKLGIQDLEKQQCVSEPQDNLKEHDAHIIRDTWRTTKDLNQTKTTKPRFKKLNKQELKKKKANQNSTKSLQNQSA